MTFVKPGVPGVQVAHGRPEQRDGRAFPGWYIVNMLDLHTHSTASDGTLSPKALVRNAMERGLTAVALTDHDTVHGVPAFVAAAEGTGLRAIPGVEIGSSWYGGSIHIVGLFIDAEDRGLRCLLQRVRGGRTTRNEKILARLNALGIPLRWDDVLSLAKGESVGRPHIASGLVSLGVCSSVRDAFERFLAEGKPAHVRRFLPLPAQTVRVIHRAGGVAAWAHPLGYRRRTPANLRQVARHLHRVGLDALEGYYSEYTPDQERLVHRIAGELGLLISGGTDFHGSHVPEVALGIGKGSLCVPDSCLPPLEALARRYGWNG